MVIIIPAVRHSLFCIFTVQMVPCTETRLREAVLIFLFKSYIIGIMHHLLIYFHFSRLTFLLASISHTMFFSSGIKEWLKYVNYGFAQFNNHGIVFRIVQLSYWYTCLSALCIPFVTCGSNANHRPSILVIFPMTRHWIRYKFNLVKGQETISRHQQLAYPLSIISV
jgi:hypothetical protein